MLLGKGPGGNTAHKKAIEEAVLEVHNLNVAVNDVPHAGSTDRAIIRDMVVHGGGTAAEAMEKMEDAIAIADKAIVRLVDEAGGLQSLVLPGVQAALEELQSAGATLALTTGNLESCAWAKLKAAGLGDFFLTGGYGSDCIHRSDILKTAIERVLASENAPDLIRDENGKYVNVFHVGDAIADMSAARDAGANGIGVLTGAFNRKQLEGESPLAVLEDLSDTRAFLGLLGVKSARQNAATE